MEKDEDSESLTSIGSKTMSGVNDNRTKIKAYLTPIKNNRENAPELASIKSLVSNQGDGPHTPTNEMKQSKGFTSVATM